MRAGFKDELLKIAGEMQGFTRIGRKPIGIERLLEREAESETKPSEIAPSGPPEKTSGAPTEVAKAGVKAGGRFGAKAMGLSALSGMASYHVLSKANEDRKTGKMLRRQQGM